MLESVSGFDSKGTAERTAAALGRVLMLDLVIRNEDRLPCRELRWRGNPANLLLADKTSSANMGSLDEAFDSAIKRFRPRVIRAIQKERRASSVDSRLSPHSPGLVSQSSDLSEITESPKSSDMSIVSPTFSESFHSGSHIVAIDSGVPRRPPVGKRANDQVIYPKLVELLLNSSNYSSNLLHDITCGKLGTASPDDADTTDMRGTETTSVVQEFRSGFRAALRDLQGFHIFLLTLHQKLDSLLRQFLTILNKTSGDFDKEDLAVPESPLHPPCLGGIASPSTPSKERVLSDNRSDYSDSELQRTAPKSSSSGHRESMDSSSPMSREGWHGKFHKGSGEPLHSLRLTAKLRDFHKFAKVCYPCKQNGMSFYKTMFQWNIDMSNNLWQLLKCHWIFYVKVSS